MQDFVGASQCGCVYVCVCVYMCKPIRARAIHCFYRLMLAIPDMSVRGYMLANVRRYINFMNVMTSLKALTVPVEPLNALNEHIHVYTLTSTVTSCSGSGLVAVTPFRWFLQLMVLL